MSKSTLHCYAKLNIFNNYMSHITNLLDKYSSNFDILSPIQIGSYFAFDQNIGKNDISILMFKEICATREDQNGWFLRMTNGIVKNTEQNILIIVFSSVDIDPAITETRRLYCQSEISNCTIFYVELETWLPKDTNNHYYEQLKLFDSAIENYVSSLIK